jgi:hypothetical protein
MQNDAFTQNFEEQVERCRSVLIKKGTEYAAGHDDRLRAFKKAAVLEDCTPMQALAGMMGKHTTSIYDMINRSYPQIHIFGIEAWDEKITDHINYLILLKALVLDEREALTKKGVKNA